MSQQVPSENPYEVLTPEANGADDSFLDVGDDAAYSIDHDQIVCGPTVSLPRCCLQTGARTDLVRFHRRTLRRLPPYSVLLLFFLAPGWLVFSFLWYFCSVRCVVSFSLSRGYLAVRRTMMILGVAGAGVGQFMALSGYVRHPYAIVAGILIFAAGLWFFLRSVTSPIWITKHHRKKQFWLAGCARIALSVMKEKQTEHGIDRPHRRRRR